MQRDIKFRGKRKGGSHWFYGDLLTKYVHHKGATIVEGSSVHYEVDIKTIGQFTGLLDNSGKEIYEGDILTDCKTNYQWTVKWDSKGTFYLFSDTDGHKRKSYFISNNLSAHKITGSIHD